MKKLKFNALIKGNKKPVDIKVDLNKKAPEEIYHKIKNNLDCTYDLEEMTNLAIKYYEKDLKDFEPREWFNLLDNLIARDDKHMFNFLVEIDGKEYPITKLISKPNEAVKIEYQDGEEFKNISL